MSDEPEISESGHAVDRDRFYVQLDKRPYFQAWGKDDQTSPLPTLKDVFVFAACLGWSRERRIRLVGRQHVGFWRSFDSRDVALLQAIAIAETGDPTVLGDQSLVIQIAEEYANGGIDQLLAYDRSDKERTLVALASAISSGRPSADQRLTPRPPGVVAVDLTEELS